MYLYNGVKVFTSQGSLYGCEKSELTNFLDSHFTDGGEVISTLRRNYTLPPENSWYSFVIRDSLLANG
jgi:hypothetical protein